MPGKTPKTLSSRVITALTLMVAIVASGYIFALWYGITSAEQSLMSVRLNVALDSAIATGRTPNLSHVYGSGPEAAKFPPIPEQWHGVPDGFSELLDDDDLFVYRKRVGQTDWLITQSQFGFEQSEIRIYLQAFIGLILAVAAAALVGILLARSIIRPLKNLSDEVEKKSRADTFTPLTTPLPDDEIGRLGHTFEDTLLSLHRSLQRERAFNADVSHELRTPLTVIRTSAELLSLQASTAQARELAERISRAEERLTRLVHVFLELARDNTKSLQQRTSPVTIVGDVVPIFNLIAQNKGIELHLNILDEPCPEVPVALFESLLSNLLRNAIQYTDRGNVTLTLDRRIVRVSDTGRGIKPQDKDRILRAFVRGSNASGEGYGLGLSLIHRICEREGWRLEFEDNFPCGTTFTVLLDSSDQSSEQIGANKDQDRTGNRKSDRESSDAEIDVSGQATQT